MSQTDVYSLIEYERPTILMRCSATPARGGLIQYVQRGLMPLLPTHPG